MSTDDTEFFAARAKKMTHKANVITNITKVLADSKFGRVVDSADDELTICINNLMTNVMRTSDSVMIAKAGKIIADEYDNEATELSASSDKKEDETVAVCSDTDTTDEVEPDPAAETADEADSDDQPATDDSSITETAPAEAETTIQAVTEVETPTTDVPENATADQPVQTTAETTEIPTTEAAIETPVATETQPVTIDATAEVAPASTEIAAEQTPETVAEIAVPQDVVASVATDATAPETAETIQTEEIQTATHDAPVDNAATEQNINAQVPEIITQPVVVTTSAGTGPMTSEPCDGTIQNETAVASQPTANA